MNLEPTDSGHGCIAFTGCYELDLTRRILGHSRTEGGLLVDVGANYGYFSLLWVAARAGNRAIAFEASPRNIPKLTENIHMNDFAQFIEIRGQAAGMKSGEMSFDLGPREQTGWGGLKNSETNSMRVSVTTLDSALAHEPAPISVLKIDVEGAETWVLRGAETLLRNRQIKNIYFEQNHERMERLGIDKFEAEAFLEAVGYKIEPLSGSEGGLREYHAHSE